MHCTVYPCSRFCRQPKRSPLIAIVIPCFNEAHRLSPGPFVSFLGGSADLFFIFVDDGSTDQTAVKLEQIDAQTGAKSRVLHLGTNQGKAEAVRQGILLALEDEPDHVGYWDGDLATPLSEIPSFIEYSNDPTRKMLFGSRIQRLGAEIERHWYRHYPGRVIAFWINAILKLPVHDTQCGAKLIKTDLARQIFAEPFISSWLFDVELFARIIGLFGRRQAAGMIYEIPLQRWADVGESKISLAYLPKIPVELFRIYRKYRKDLR
ncbi:MAG: glycosyltransferase [Desulfobulbaceae bacterium]|nr:MAG: glycosyltransferase [Desulfobulbaceae bacterium]